MEEKWKQLDDVDLQIEFIQLYARMEMATDPEEKERLKQEVAEVSKLVSVKVHYKK